MNKPPALPFCRADLLFLLATVVVGYLFWRFEILDFMDAGIGTCLFFLFALGSVAVYLKAKKQVFDRGGTLLLAAALLGALPFALYGSVDGLPPVTWLHINIEFGLCLFWLAWSTKTLIARPLSLLLAADWFNQFVIVPFANLGKVFGSLFARRPGTRRSWLITALIVMVSLLVALPLLFLVLALLSSSDEGFSGLLDWLAAHLSLSELLLNIWYLLIGLPIAVYLFASVLGNQSQNNVALLERPGLLRGFAAVHALPSVALILPVALFVAVYLLYFGVMGNYLFSALNGQLPASFTYAQYSRQGFFELCGVALINLIVLACLWSFARRSYQGYPLALRVLSAALCFLTCLLVVTAAAKMLLYVQAYGLSPLRFYTSCFMLLMLAVFILLSIWSIRPFNAARPAIALALAVFLAISLVNVDGAVAGYNTSRYLSGQTSIMDINSLEQGGRAAQPYLRQLAQLAPDVEVRRGAQAALDEQDMQESMDVDRPWYYWSIFG
ncbi:MAG: DUF4173 domain-containing protein [Actinomycetia bacterium]|nr:DUF4173 domain-containing protein [Actinomycetes bacterium]